MQTHRIKEMQLEARASTRKAASALQAQLGFWMHTRAFQKRLEASLNTMVDESTYLRIETLELEVHVKDQLSFLENFEKALKKAILKAQNKQELQNGQKIKKQSKAERIEEMCMLFLQLGTFPADISLELIQAAREQLISIPKNTAFFSKIKVLATHDRQIWTRLLFIVGQKGFEIMLKTQWNLSNEVFEALLIPLKKQKTDALKTIYLKLIHALELNKPKEELLKIVQQDYLGSTDSSNLIEKQPDTNSETLAPKAQASEQKLAASASSLEKDLKQIRSSKPSIEKQLLQATGTGMVLLWTRFNRIFKQLNWVANKSFVDIKAQQKAMLWMDYLVNGERETIWEDELLLYKLLCGWAITEPIDLSLQLNKLEKQAANDLLDTFLKGWLPNKAFSRDWLRNNFLQRTGTLEKRFDKSWQLSIEPKTEDILLNRLPSDVSYAIVRYNWMEGMLFVEWV